MSIKFGLYDFFSYTVPGSLYLLAFVYIALILGLIPFDFNSLVNFVKDQLAILILGSYVLGIIFDPISRPWYHLFAPMGLEKAELDYVMRTYRLETEYNAREWALLLAHVRVHNVDLASEIEKHNATKIMLRNVSFALLILATLTLIQFIRTNFYTWNLIHAVILIAFSIVAAREALKFDKWFYDSLYQTVAALKDNKLIRRRTDDISIEMSKTTNRKNELSDSESEQVSTKR